MSSSPLLEGYSHATQIRLQERNLAARAPGCAGSRTRPVPQGINLIMVAVVGSPRNSAPIGWSAARRVAIIGSETCRPSGDFATMPGV